MTYYRRLLSAAAVLLKPAGCLIVELGVGQFNAVSALSDRTRLSVLHCRKDQAGIERALVLRRLD
jgi:methylase of polypeptide subunit release factors